MTSLRETVSDLRGAIHADLQERPVASVQAWFDSVRVVEANEKRDAAYRSRDVAMARIWSIDQLHHVDETRDDLCSCGKPKAKCRELAVLDPIVEFLDRWEERQLERLRADQPHGLPHDHPEVLKRRPRYWHTG